MKKLAVLICVLSILLQSDLKAQGTDKEYIMFLTIYLEPNPGHSRELIDGVKAHNAKYHSEGDSRAYLWNVVTGPRSNQYIWGQGPVTYDVMDTPLSEDHNVDWDINVASHCRNVDDFRLWKRDDDLTYNPENQVFSNNVLARIFDLKGGIGNSQAVLEAIGMITEVFEAKKYPRTRRVYTSEFKTDKATDIMLIYPFSSWTEFEESKGLPPGFQKDYESIHGMGSYQRMVDIMDENTDGWYDEVRVMVQ